MEFVCRRYHNIEYIMSLDIETFCELITEGHRKEEEERLHAQWCSMLPYMSVQRLKYISFEDYKAQCRGENIDLRSTDDIIKELEELHGQKLL